MKLIVPTWKKKIKDAGNFVATKFDMNIFLWLFQLFLQFMKIKYYKFSKDVTIFQIEGIDNL